MHASSATQWTTKSCYPVARIFQGELDELEREEFFRLKKVQGNKQKAIGLRDEENKALASAQVSAAQRDLAQFVSQT